MTAPNFGISIYLCGNILKATTILDLSVGDYIDVVVGGNTSDGGTLSIFNTSPYQFSVFQGFKIGA